MYGGNYFGSWYFGGRYFGKAGLTVPGYYFGGRYFGGAYFGPRYFGQVGDIAPHTVAVAAGLAATGVGAFSTVTISSTNLHTVAISQGLAGAGTGAFNITSFDSTLGDLFDLSAPLSLSAAGSAGFAVTLEFGYVSGTGRYFGGGYFGQRYYGPSYFGTDAPYTVEVTSGLVASGAGTLSADLRQSLTFVPTAPLAATASTSFSVSLSLGAFTVQVTQGLVAAGAAALAATLGTTSEYKSPRSLPARQGSRRMKVFQGARSLKVRS